MDDPIRRHPTRAEQLDILVSIVTDQAQPDDMLVDLGCGTGYLGHLLLRARPDLRYVGVDRKGESLAAARDNLAAHGARVWFVEGDLSDVTAIGGLDGPFRFVVSALTFHDLDDAAKVRVIAWAAHRLAADGYLLLYDRLRLNEPKTFPLQQSIWRRLARIHDEGMRSAESFAAYEADLGSDNRPALLVDYARWFLEARLHFLPLHLHGNIALMGGAPRR